MVKTEAFPTIRMKIDRLLKITNEYQFNDLVKAVYCINLCINNRSVLESCLALNACLIEYEEKGSKRIGTYDEFKGFFGKIYDVMKPGIADDYTVEDFGEVQLRYNDKFYRVIIGTGHNNVYACLNFLPTLARNISREEELCLALEYVSGTIDYFIEENKNDGVVEKRFVLPTEILFYKVQKFFKEEVKKYDILELDSLMMSEGTTIEKSHFVCREDNIYPLYNVSLLIDLYDIWENKIDFKEQISVANEGIIDRIYSLFEMDRSRSCSIFAPAMIFPEQKYDSSQRTYTFIAKASRGVVVALNADEYEEGQLEKEIANIEKYHKSGTLHIAETFNRFDKSGLRGIHIPADMPIEYLIYDSFMNPNQMHMSLGEEGKKRKTCTALDVIYYLNFMDDIDELFEYLSYSNEKDYESSFGFGSDAALYFTWKNQDRYIAKGAIIFNMVDVGYDTENEAVVDYFKEELKDYPFHMRDYLFREPFSWKIEKRDFDTYEYTVKHMSYENFMEIVKQAAGKTFQIALGGAGDPNKHPQIEDILKSCRAYRIIPNMTTSGFLITDNEVGLIKQYCGAVAVSWYSRFMDGKESNQETIDAVERLVKSGCTTNIHYVVSKDTINEAITRLEMDSFPKGVNAVIFILYKPVGNGIIEKVLKNTDSRIERFISLATKVKHPYRVGFDTCFTPALLRWGDTVPAVSIDACEAATFSMYIDSQMNCYPCSFGIWDKSISESMNSKTLREIWQGDKFVAFREQRKEKCSSCRQMELCRGGCRLGIDIDMC